jgi:hypothetical protein
MMTSIAILTADQTRMLFYKEIVLSLHPSLHGIYFFRLSSI